VKRSTGISGPRSEEKPGVRIYRFQLSQACNKRENGTFQKTARLQFRGELDILVVGKANIRSQIRKEKKKNVK